MRLLLLIALLMTGSLLTAKKLKMVDYVDIPRYMGDWYVIAVIPNIIEKNAVNSIESYSLNPDGTIAVRYTYRKGSPQGKQKLMRPKGKIYNTKTNSEWRMRVFRPFWAKFMIIDLAEDYRYTVVGVPNRKMLWIMSRSPQMTEADYTAVIKKLKKQDYNIDKIKKIPQIW
ncbi:MAG: lipocalin family protein [Candidatus Cloacimonetes bacterium]|jgi:apolipoprotein D and lipocalin family protein|nr:lipocalin family protein [Candidatus Cloacimonadota bacterium]MDY0172066.1 lipocalin family protein [Candidatus Cloacimonadaceae bacterium]